MSKKRAPDVFDIFEDEEMPETAQNSAAESDEDHPQNSAPSSDARQTQIAWEG